MWADAWKWLKSAPLPVVMAFNLSLGIWLWGVSGAFEVHKVWAEEQAKGRQNEAAKVEKKLEQLDAKIERLLEAVLSLQAEARIAAPRDKRAKKSEEGEKP